MFKRYMALGLAFLFLALCFMGCQAEEEMMDDLPLPEPDITQGLTAIEDETVVIGLTQSLSRDLSFYERMAEIINGLLKGHNIPARIRFEVIHQNDLSNIDMITMYAMGDIYEESYEYLAKEGYFYDLTDALEGYPDLYTLSTPQVLDMTRVDGRIYAFPLMYVERDNTWSFYKTAGYIRSDILDQLEAGTPTTTQALFDLCVQARDAGLDHKLAYYCEYMMYPPYMLHRTYEEWPFYVDGLFLYDMEGNVTSYLESDVFDQDAYWLRKFNDEGLLQPLTMGSEQFTFTESWDALASFYPLGSANTDPSKVVTTFQLAPERENFMMERPYFQIFAITEASPRKQMAMEVLNAFYTKQDIHDALTLGEEGVDWRLYEDGSFEILSGENHLSLAHWEMLRPEYSVSNSMNELAFQNIIDFPAPLFLFQDKQGLNVQLRYNNLFHGLNGAMGYTIGLGTKIQFENTVDALKIAGLDELIEECDAQYKAFLLNFEP